MITLQSMSLIERVKCLWPSYREKRNDELYQAIKFLVEHPEEPCIVGDAYIPNGYGKEEVTP